MRRGPGWQLFVVGLVLGFVLLISVSQWFGATSILIAAGLWAAVLAGLLHAEGDLPWVDRYATLSRLLASYAPRAPAPSGYSSRPAAKAKVVPSAEGPGSGIANASNVSSLIGIQSPLQEIRILLKARSLILDSEAPATFILLHGPRGTGKSSLAWWMAGQVGEMGIVKTNRVVAMADAVLPGLGSTYAPSPALLQKVQDMVLGALDGIIVLDELDSLVNTGTTIVTDIGARLVNVAVAHPKRLLIIGTGTHETAERLRQETWLGKFHTINIDFRALTGDELADIVYRSLSVRGYRCDEEAIREMRRQTSEMIDHGEVGGLDNAYTARRFSEAILLCQIRRLAKQQGAVDPKFIIGRDVEAVRE